MIMRFFREHVFNYGEESTATKILYLLSELGVTGGKWAAEYDKDQAEDTTAVSVEYFEERDVSNMSELAPILAECLSKTMDYDGYKKKLDSKQKDDIRRDIALALYEYTKSITPGYSWLKGEESGHSTRKIGYVELPKNIFSDKDKLKECIKGVLQKKHPNILSNSDAKLEKKPSQSSKTSL